MSEEPLVIVCGPREAMDHLPKSARDALIEIDGPFQIVNCKTCGGECLLSRSSRELIADRRGTQLMCTSCLMNGLQDANDQTKAE